MHEQRRPADKNSDSSNQSSPEVSGRSVNQQAAKFKTSASRHALEEQWKLAAKEAQKEHGSAHTSQLLLVLTGLQALQLSPVKVCEITSQTSPRVPILELGKTPDLFSIRFEEQGVFLGELLKRLHVPIALRCEQLFKAGRIITFTPEDSRVDFLSLQPRYSVFFAELQRAYSESLHRAQQLPQPTPTPVEQRRIRLNLAMTEKLREFVDVFERGPDARVGLPLNVIGAEGEPVCLFLGKAQEADPYLRDTHRYASREIISLERLALLSRFGRFLREQYFNQ
jgi:hypothetical protein